MKTRYFITDFISDIRRNLERYKLRCIIVAASFILGVILGIVFLESIRAVQWLMYEDYCRLDDLLGIEGFFQAAMMLFFSGFRFVLLALICCLAKKLTPVFYFISFVRGMAFIAAVITAIKEFMIIGVIYVILIPIVFQLVVLTIFIICCAMVSAMDNCNISVFKERAIKLGWLALASAAVLLAISLILSFILVLILKPLLMFI